MTISVYQGDMSTDDKPESSHEFNFFLDRQLQNKLLEIDEELLSTENYLAQNRGLHHVSNSEGKSQFVKSQTRCEEITGWIQNGKTIFRKADKENKPTKEFIQPWKEYKTKAQLDTFVFKHYPDPKHYMEQYRHEHALVLGQRSPMTRSELGSGGDLKRHMGHHSSPSPNNTGASSSGSQNYVPPQPSVSSNNNVRDSAGYSYLQARSSTSNNSSSNSVQNGGSQLLTASMHYTNKKDCASLPNNSTPNSQSKVNNKNKSSHNHNQNSNQGHQCTKHVHTPSDQGYKYKLAPEAMWRSESSQSSEHYEGRTSRMQSGKGDGRGKMPTKVMVPAGAPNGIVKQHPLQTVTVQSRTPTNSGMVDSSSHITNTVPTGSVRTLDTLACVAADKQRRPLSTSVHVRTLGHMLLDTAALQGHAIKRPASSLSIVVRKIKSKSEELQHDPDFNNRIDTDVSTPDTPHESFISEADVNDAVSLSKLSTTCLGADARVKTDSLTFSNTCSFHAFQSEMELDDARVDLNSKSVIWHPAVSSPFIKKETFQGEFVVPSPFKGYLKAVAKNVDATAESRKIRKEIRIAIKRTDESKVGFPAIKNNAKSGIFVTSDINLSNQAKFCMRPAECSIQTSEGTIIKAERRHSAYFGRSRLFNTKNLRSRFAGYIKSRSNCSSRRNSAVIRSGCALTRLDNLINSAKVFTDDHSDIPENMKFEVIEPPLNYWSHSNDTEEKDEQEQNGSISSSRIESIKKVAEYLLKENNLVDCFSPRDVFMPDGNDFGKELTVGNGIDPEFQSSAAGLTWCERLEMLRAVNKRPEKIKVKKPKLRYYKDSPVQTHEQPGPLFSSRARLFEQRRIKHVLEQTKLKGVDHYEWLSDGRVRRYRYQHSEFSDDDDDTSTSSSEYEDEEETMTSLSITTKPLSTNGDGTSSENPVSQKYQVPLAVKGGGWRVLPSPNFLSKSHSTL